MPSTSIGTSEALPVLYTSRKDGTQKNRRSDLMLLAVRHAFHKSLRFACRGFHEARLYRLIHSRCSMACEATWRKHITLNDTEVGFS